MMNSSMTQAGTAKNDRTTLVFMGILTLFLAWVVTKEVDIPKNLMIIMAVIAGVILFIQGLARPEFVAYVLVAYLPYSKVLAGDFGGMAMAFNFTNLLMGFLMFAWFTGRYAQGEPMWLKTPLNLPIYLFLFVGLIAIVRASASFGDAYILTAVIEYKRWITPIFLYFLVLNTVKERQTIENVVMIIMFVTTVVGLMAIYDYIDLGDIHNMEKARIGGIADQPNMLAAFFNYYMFLPFAFFLLNMNKLPYWLLTIPFLIDFRGIMVTFSRGGYMAFAAGLYAISFFRSKWLFALLILFSFYAYVNPSILPGGIQYRMGQTFQPQDNSFQDNSFNEEHLETSSRTRVEVWKGAMEMIKEHPWFGVGYGLFQAMIPYYWVGQRAIDAHNTYLIIAAEMGIPALLIFLLIIVIAFWNTLQLYRKTKNNFSKAVALGFLGGLFGLLMSNMFGSRLDSQEISSYFWILAALIMRLRILDQKEAEAEKIEKGGKSLGTSSQTPNKTWWESYAGAH